MYSTHLSQMSGDGPFEDERNQPQQWPGQGGLGVQFEGPSDFGCIADVLKLPDFMKLRRQARERMREPTTFGVRTSYSAALMPGKGPKPLKSDQLVRSWIC